MKSNLHIKSKGVENKRPLIHQSVSKPLDVIHMVIYVTPVRTTACSLVIY